MIVIYKNCSRAIKLSFFVREPPCDNLNALTLTGCCAYGRMQFNWDSCNLRHLLDFQTTPASSRKTCIISLCTLGCPLLAIILRFLSVKALPARSVNFPPASWTSRAPALISQELKSYSQYTVKRFQIER